MATADCAMSIASTVEQNIRDCRFLSKTYKRNYNYEMSVEDLRRVFEAKLKRPLDGIEFGVYNSNEVKDAVQRYLLKAYGEKTNVELVGIYLIQEDDKWMALGLKEDRAVLVYSVGVDPSIHFRGMLQKFFYPQVTILQTTKPSWETGNHAILALQNCITLRDHVSRFGNSETALSDLLAELRRVETLQRSPEYNENARISLAKCLVRYNYEQSMKFLDQTVPPMKTTKNRHFRDDTADSNAKVSRLVLAASQPQNDERLSDEESIPEQPNFDRDDKHEHSSSFDALSTISKDAEESPPTVRAATTSKFRRSGDIGGGLYMTKQSSATKARTGKGIFWKNSEKTNLIHFLVKRKGSWMKKLKRAREHRKLKPTAKRFRLPDNFWTECSQYLSLRACSKPPKKCLDEAYVVSRISQDDLIKNHDLSKEEAQLMYNLFSRQNRKARVRSRRMPVQPAVRRQQNKAIWDISEEIQLLIYLVRNRKETLKMMNFQKSFPRFWHQCADFFQWARSNNAYRMRSVILSGLPPKILRTKYQLTQEEIELLQGYWRPEGGQFINNARMKLVEKRCTC